LIPIGLDLFWRSDENKKKYILTCWNNVCRPKDRRGLGIEVLELINKCLINKWLFKLLSEEGMWQQLLHNEYHKNKTLVEAEEN
jgi:hypothetical protein